MLKNSVIKDSDALGHIAEACFEGIANKNHKGPLHLPNLTELGIVKAAELSNGRFPIDLDASAKIIGAYAYSIKISSGKDMPSGHWEIPGVPVLFYWDYFLNKEDSFSKVLLDNLMESANLLGYLGNCHSSGTVILKHLGEEQVKTGHTIIRR